MSNEHLYGAAAAAAWRALLAAALVALVSLRTDGAVAGARPSRPDQDLLTRTVTLFQGSTSFQQEFDGRVAGRHVAVIALSDLDGVPLADAPAASLYREIARQVPGWVGPPHGALKRSAIAATGAGAGAMLSVAPDGSETCIAFVGKRTRPGELVRDWSGGEMARFPHLLRRHDELKLQRFAAYHEIGGHCADPAFSLGAGDSIYRRARAEMRADTFAALAMIREEGTSETADEVAVLRRAGSLLGAIARDPAAGFDAAVLYRTAPGIEAAIAWAKARGGIGTATTGDLLAAADTITARIMPDRPSFDGFAQRLIRLASDLRRRSGDPRALLARHVSPQDRPWFLAGAAAVRSLFGIDLVAVSAR